MHHFMLHRVRDDPDGQVPCGLIDALLMRISDLIFSFPSFVLALFLMVVLGANVVTVAAAIALVYVPIFARLTRNLALIVKEEPFVQAARLMGQSTSRILFAEILPNISAPIMVQASIGIAFAVVIEAGLSFLGLGVQPPLPSLGVIMADGRIFSAGAMGRVIFCHEQSDARIQFRRTPLDLGNHAAQLGPRAGLVTEVARCRAKRAKLTPSGALVRKASLTKSRSECPKRGA